MWRNPAGYPQDMGLPGIGAGVMLCPMSVIRTATADDLPGLLALYQHLSPGDAAPDHAQSQAIFARFLRYEGSAIWLAEVAGQVVASCTLIVVPNLTRGGRPYAVIENVVTHADHRQRGLGKAVMRAALDAAWAADCYRVTLATGSQKPGTHAFYREVGFDGTKTCYQIRRVPARVEP